MMRRFCFLIVVVFLVPAALAFARGPNGPPDIVRVTGEITSVDAAALQIVVEGITVQVTPNTVIRIDGAPTDFATLEVGMTVKVCGRIVDGVLYAHQISVMYKGQ